MIIVAGDSWGEGTSNYKPQSESDERWPGFHQFWINNSKLAMNVSRGGYSNNEAISRLEHYLVDQKDCGVHAVIIWLTCVLRDYSSDHPIKDIHQWTQNHYELVFDRLITLASRHQIKIYVLGGLGDIPRHWPNAVGPGVEILLHSTAYFVDNSFHNETPFGHFVLVDNIADFKQRMMVFEESKRKFDYMQSRHDIFPDGGHLSPGAYQQIYEFINPIIFF